MKKKEKKSKHDIQEKIHQLIFIVDEEDKAFLKKGEMWAINRLMAKLMSNPNEHKVEEVTPITENEE